MGLLKSWGLAAIPRFYGMFPGWDEQGVAILVWDTKGKARPSRRERNGKDLEDGIQTFPKIHQTDPTCLQGLLVGMPRG